MFKEGEKVPTHICKDREHTTEGVEVIQATFSSSSAKISVLPIEISSFFPEVLTKSIQRDLAKVLLYKLVS